MRQSKFTNADCNDIEGVRRLAFGQQGLAVLRQ